MNCCSLPYDGDYGFLKEVSYVFYYHFSIMIIKTYEKYDRSFVKEPIILLNIYLNEYKFIALNFMTVNNYFYKF